MKIMASVRGDFVRPVGQETGIDRVVSFVQLEAQHSFEVEALRGIYEVLRFGGSIEVDRRSNVVTVEANPVCVLGMTVVGDGDGYGEYPTHDQAVMPTLVGGPLVAEGEVAEREADHEHVYDSALGCFEDGSDTWLRCGCGEWAMVTRIGKPEAVDEDGNGEEMKAPKPRWKN